METNYQTLVSKYLSNGFYTAYGESHGATLEPEDFENDHIERDGEVPFVESDGID